MCRPIGLTLLLLVLSHDASAGAGTVRVTRLRAPNAGIQPQAVMDARGTLHLLYYAGDPGGGDLFYTRRAVKATTFSRPLRVNSQPGSAIAVGTIRGGQLAVGRSGHVHVVWNGSGRALPRAPGAGSPVLYSRLNPAGTAFEAQRNLMRQTYLLDGGATVAADGNGNVYVAWHAAAAAGGDEQSRRLWVAHSRDGGASFRREAAAFSAPTGACACCGTRAFTDRNERLHLLYRSASTPEDRDVYLLRSRAPGRPFQGTRIHGWKIASCPMSSHAFAEGAGAVLAAWETAGQIYSSRIDPQSGKRSPPIPAPGQGGERKHPSLAVGRHGETLLVWTEGTGWEKGGALAWQMFDRAGRPTAARGRVARGVPVWSLATVVATPSGFLILH